MDSTRNERGVKTQRQRKERNKTQDSENSNNALWSHLAQHQVAGVGPLARVDAPVTGQQHSTTAKGVEVAGRVDSRTQSETKLPPALSGDKNPVRITLLRWDKCLI